jgi:WhiB family transcriptional regulator, redox-sensing transcriptional regulator
MAARSHADLWPVGDRPWVDRAACRDLDTNIWYATRGESLNLARAICADCPVRRACLDYAIDNHESHGVWGGTSERQRRRIRHQRLVALREAA